MTVAGGPTVAATPTEPIHRPVATRPGAGGRRRESPDPTAAVAAEHDHLSDATLNRPSSPPGEVAASGGRKLKLIRPRRWTELDTEQAAQDACACVARTFKTIGLRPTETAFHALGQSIQRWDEEQRSREDMWRWVRNAVDAFGAPGPYEDWLEPL